MQSSKFGDLSRGRNGEDPRPAKCRSCDGTIWWVVTRRGKNMPVNPDDTSHFETCPKAKEHRGQGSTSGSGAQQPAPSGPVFTGVVEAVDATDPEWFVIRVKQLPGHALAEGQLVKLMKRDR